MPSLGVGARKNVTPTARLATYAAVLSG